MMKDRESERIEFLGIDERAQKALIDLSTTGAAFIHPSKAGKGTRLSVKIKDQLFDAIVVYCQQRVDGFRIGLQFRNVAPEVQKTLKVWVDEFSRGVPLTCEIIGQPE